ncbi:MAG: hypothetical protein KAI40_00190 [Desulfobacterales bacterium]|nr:hypothetical protein [Desulfobacterales bacterium]
MKKGILIQARLSSKRFPNKMLNQLGGVPLIQYVFNRCKISSQADMVGVITSIEQSDDLLYDYCKSQNMPVFRGSLNNVLDRYIQAANHFGCNILCRVCGDSPFVDTVYIDKLFMAVQKGDEYLSVKGGLNGFFSEIVTLKALRKMQSNTNAADDLEHVTKYIRKNLKMFNYRIFQMNTIEKKLQNFSLTVDYENDLEIANSIITKGLHGYDFLTEELIEILNINYNELIEL